MACDHCGKARQASKLGLKAVLMGDIGGAVEQAKEVGSRIKAKLIEVKPAAMVEE